VGPGSVVAGRYEIVRQIARGGMADIFEANDERQRERVVLKILREELSSDAEVLARFHREARAASQLDSPYVARILDFGATDDNRPFMAMELLEGNDLARELDLRGVLPLAEAAKHITQACAGMIVAHDAGIVHRDLKPSNLFLAMEGGRRTIKVLDFGISKITRQQDENITLTKALFGSPLYMSPEQFRSAKAADVRSDIWSLGVILYEMLTGLPPFVAENAPAVGLAITKEPHVPPSIRRTELPKAVDQVIDGALEKDPAKRYQSARELLRAVETLLPNAREDTPTRLNLLDLQKQRPIDAPTTMDDPVTHTDSVPSAAPAPPAGVMTRIDEESTATTNVQIVGVRALELEKADTLTDITHPRLSDVALQSSTDASARGDSARSSHPPQIGSDPGRDIASSTSPLSVPPPPPRRRGPVVWGIVAAAVGLAAVAWMLVPPRAPPPGTSAPEPAPPKAAPWPAGDAEGGSPVAPPTAGSSAAPRPDAPPTDVDALPPAKSTSKPSVKRKQPPKKQQHYVPKDI
jgi:serine/threonine-protein kinase